jgi:hypothetical protein
MKRNVPDYPDYQKFMGYIPDPGSIPDLGNSVCPVLEKQPVNPTGMSISG